VQITVGIKVLIREANVETDDVQKIIDYLVVREECDGPTAAMISCRFKVFDIAGFGGVDNGFLAN
jgi:hypothetical protein